jgi:16S rRNA (adenine1518-N6/adenine1519-N6)-dimethyltransferase
MAHKARKRFGQNFLVDQQVINQIVSTIAPKRMDSIIEIGPGKGALTFPLIDHLDHIHVIEIDRDLISLLQKKSNKKITIHESDALVFNFDQFTKNIRIVGNLPYNISSPLLFHLLNYRDSIIDMTFMLQKEVVDRIVAAPGSKVYGRTSVIMQAFFLILNLCL